MYKVTLWFVAILTSSFFLPSFPPREYRPMERVNFVDNYTKVAAVNPKTYIFEPNMSRGSEDDLIRTVNIPAMVRHRLCPKCVLVNFVYCVITG